MVQIPIINGIYANESPDLRVSYPVNLCPIVKESGISAGYLRPAEGIRLFCETEELDRGGINWNGVMYRVIGDRLFRIDSDGTQTLIGIVGNGGRVTFDYSFDYLAVCSNNDFFLYDGTTFAKVSDADLLDVIDFVWVDGYFLTTDGEFLVVTELNNPFSVNPLKYGSSEIDPDPVVAVWKLRNEVYAVNRYTIEVFDNIGGDLFPFQRIEGAQIQKGAVGTHACCVYADTIAFLGSGRNESLGIYLGVNATAQKISTQEIDEMLLEYTEDQLANCILEAKNHKNLNYLYVHLPDFTMVFDINASKVAGNPVWFKLTSSILGDSQYQANNFVYCYDKWIAGNPTANKLGEMVEDISSHYGETVRWEFGTLIIYNESRGAIINMMELVALTGRIQSGLEPLISTSYSNDGVTWAQEKYISSGKQGQRNKRLVWFQQGSFRNWRIQRFKGDSQSHISMARLEANLEQLAY